MYTPRNTISLNRREHTDAVHRTEKAQRKNTWSLRWHRHILAKPPHTFALFILVAGLLVGIAFSRLGDAGGIVTAVLASVLLALELGLCLLSGEVLRTKARWQRRLAGGSHAARAGDGAPAGHAGRRDRRTDYARRALSLIDARNFGKLSIP
jgi:hypothetical protein